MLKRLALFGLLWILQHDSISAQKNVRLPSNYNQYGNNDPRRISDSMYDFLAARGRRDDDLFWANRGKRNPDHVNPIRALFLEKKFDGMYTNKKNSLRPNGFNFLLTGKRSLELLKRSMDEELQNEIPAIDDLSNPSEISDPQVDSSLNHEDVLNKEMFEDEIPDKTDETLMELKRSIKNFYEKKSSNKVKPDDIYSFYAGRGKRTGSIPTFDSFYAGRGKRNFAQNKDIFIAGRG